MRWVLFLTTPCLVKSFSSAMPGRKAFAAYAASQDGSFSGDVGVLFDFDGTLGDTESPAMEVAYWELAPFFASRPVPTCIDYVRENAGRAFEHMVEDCEKDRASNNLGTIASVLKTVTSTLEADYVKDVNDNRVKCGLPVLEEAITQYDDLLTMQKEETVQSLAVCATEVPGCKEMLEGLDAMGKDKVKYCIATTSGKPRVPVSIDAAGLRAHFTPESVHSGESDFTPPRFKPDPAVYFRAAEWVGIDPANCIAVEDSASGVGSASNADIALIVGYVGASHIAPSAKESHAKMLMSGTRADSGRGATFVLEDMRDLPSVVAAFRESKCSGSDDLLSAAAGCKGKVYMP
eukprot:CAMPEP_0185770496 /NCGR_PEP_ID=MMETSP1174-20130828/59401_1 /TAXON_ID=35687 /ORGANISM="Dictyocha speculum, Strain CCMP1381" /LENGTH=347 /DNA_ID=CAMNT_0028455941 /DNA_START=85 /DNA_END=1128 /DNA_ORIENTATION=+